MNRMRERDGESVAITVSDRNPGFLAPKIVGRARGDTARAGARSACRSAVWIARSWGEPAHPGLDTPDPAPALDLTPSVGFCSVNLWSVEYPSFWIRNSSVILFCAFANSFLTCSWKFSWICVKCRFGCKPYLHKRIFVAGMFVIRVSCSRFPSMWLEFQRARNLAENSGVPPAPPPPLARAVACNLFAACPNISIYLARWGNCSNFYLDTVVPYLSCN